MPATSRTQNTCQSSWMKLLQTPRKILLTFVDQIKSAYSIQFKQEIQALDSQLLTPTAGIP